MVIRRLPFRPEEPVLLEQVDRKRFRLCRGYTYIDPDGEEHDVIPDRVGETDLASVPSILWWFVASYGRQTRAALLHDQLVDEIERHDADWVFRCALGDSGIGWARRWLVWSAVSFESTFRVGFMGRDDEKSAALAEERARKKAGGKLGSSKRRKKRSEVRRQRQGRAVTVVGFLLVALHLACSAAAIAWAVEGSMVAVTVATLVALSWLAAWGAWRSLRWAGLGRLLSLLGGLIVVLPFTAVLLVPIFFVWILERVVWAARTAFWLIFGRPRGHLRPPVPDFGSTRTEGPQPLQRL